MWRWLPIAAAAWRAQSGVDDELLVFVGCPGDVNVGLMLSARVAECGAVEPLHPQRLSFGALPARACVVRVPADHHQRARAKRRVKTGGWIDLCGDDARIEPVSEVGCGGLGLADCGAPSCEFGAGCSQLPVGVFAVGKMLAQRAAVSPEDCLAVDRLHTNSTSASSAFGGREAREGAYVEPLAPIPVDGFAAVVLDVAVEAYVSAREAPHRFCQ